MIASTHQVLSVWQQLEDAYFATNSYGGDTAEIYFYLLLPCHPGYYQTNGDHNSAAFGNINCLADHRAILDFIEILTLFSEKRECHLIVEGVGLEQWKPEPVNFHRVHVKVVPWGEEEEEDEAEAEEE